MSALQASDFFYTASDLMNILGPDELIFGITDLAAGEQFLTDYGLL